MTPDRVAAALAVGGGAWLALFSLVFSAGAAMGVWPEPPAGFLSGWDLWAGIAFAVLLLATLLRPRRPEPVR